mmetsp:Transcript_85641/g.223181  ORF Transcript_85641/g.223181 Transcript_85641/m.223181 type:complete len:254 (-) Transcript_85641:112-873(-)
MTSVICLTVSFALLFLAAHCRWQHPALEVGALLQPGVAATLLLGCVVMLLAAILHFVMAHMLGHARIDDLAAAQDASQGLRDALSAHGMPGKQLASSSPTILVDARARGMMRYELSISVTDQLTKLAHLPIVVIAWLLPFGGLALAGVAMLLQLLQALSWRIYAGQVMAIAGVFVAVVGVALAVTAESGPRAKSQERQRNMKRHSMVTKSWAENFSEVGSTHTASGMRRRDFVKSRVAGLFSSGSPPRGSEQS